MWHDPDSDEGSTDEDQRFDNLLQNLKENDPDVTEIDSNYWYGEYMFDLSADAWEEIGQDITNNTHLEELTLWESVLNEQKMTSLFRGLTGSNSIKRISLSGDEQIFGVEGVRSMVPFLQNASNLKKLNVSENNIGSEGFNLLMRALSNSPIQELQCNSCGIESIEMMSTTYQKS